MKETGYVYSSTELSRYYGISIKGMEFYEQKDLVHPERIGNGKTRRYDLTDCYQLASARMLRNCGFCVGETAALLKDNEPGRLEAEFGARAEKLEDSIRLQEGVLRGMRRKADAIRRVREGDLSPCMKEHGGFRRLFVRRFAGSHTSTVQETGQFSLWNSLMPITEASLRYPREDLLSEGQALDTEIGMIIDEEDFERYRLRAGNRISRIAPGRAVYCITEGKETDLGRKDALRPVLDYIHSEGLVITGDGFSRMIFVMKKDGEARKRYDEVWIPVE